MDDTINFKFYFQSSSEAIADMKKKRERWKYKNWNISRSFLDEIKSIFHNYLRTIFLLKKKKNQKWQTQALSYLLPKSTGSEAIIYQGLT